VHFALLLMLSRFPGPYGTHMLPAVIWSGSKNTPGSLYSAFNY